MGNYESFLKARDIDSGVGEIEEEKEAANLDATNPSEASQANDDTQNLTDQNGDLEQNEGSDKDPSAEAGVDAAKEDEKNEDKNGDGAKAGAESEAKPAKSK